MGGKVKVEWMRDDLRVYGSVVKSKGMEMEKGFVLNLFMSTNIREGSVSSHAMIVSAVRDVRGFRKEDWG